jgi:hypothetical protein
LPVSLSAAAPLKACVSAASADPTNKNNKNLEKSCGSKRLLYHSGYFVGHSNTALGDLWSQ